MDRTYAYKLPIDVIKGLPNITMLGNRRLIVSNYKKLLDFDSNSIKLCLKHSDILTVVGENLYIESYNIYELCISGIIKGINFV